MTPSSRSPPPLLLVPFAWLRTIGDSVEDCGVILGLIRRTKVGKNRPRCCPTPSFPFVERLDRATVMRGRNERAPGSEAGLRGPHAELCWLHCMQIHHLRSFCFFRYHHLAFTPDIILGVVLSNDHGYDEWQKQEDTGSSRSQQLAKLPSITCMIGYMYGKA